MIIFSFGTPFICSDFSRHFLVELHFYPIKLLQQALCRFQGFPLFLYFLHPLSSSNRSVNLWVRDCFALVRPLVCHNLANVRVYRRLWCITQHRIHKQAKRECLSAVCECFMSHLLGPSVYHCGQLGAMLLCVALAWLLAEALATFLLKRRHACYSSLTWHPAGWVVPEYWPSFQHISVGKKCWLLSTL